MVQVNEQSRYDVKRRKGYYGWSAHGPDGLTVRNMTREEAEALALSLVHAIAFDLQTGKYVFIKNSYLQPTAPESTTGCVVVEGIFTNPLNRKIPTIHLWLNSAM